MALWKDRELRCLKGENMVTFHTWSVDGDFLTAEVSVSGYPETFKIVYKISTEEMKSSTVLPDHIRSMAKRATIAIYAGYISGKRKMNTKEVVAWG